MANTQKLYVANIPFDSTEEELSEFFAEYGAVMSCKIINDRETGCSRGFGFVEVNDIDETAANIDGEKFQGRPLVIREAKDKK